MGSKFVRKSLGVAKTSCLKDMRHLFRLANLTEVHLVQLGGRKADSYCYQQTSCIMEKLWWPWLELAGGWLVGGWVPSGKDERDWCSLLSSHLELCCLEILNSVSKNRAISQPLTWDTWVRCRQNLFYACPGHKSNTIFPALDITEKEQTFI